ncbi:hypothetical protein D3C78_730350 [compost metagenome]
MLGFIEIDGLDQWLGDVGFRRFPGDRWSEQIGISTEHLRQPGFALAGQFQQLGHFRDGDAIQGIVGQCLLDRCNNWQAVEATNFMTQAQQCAVEMEQRRLALGLDQALGIHGLALFGLGHGLQGEAGKEQFLIGAGVEFLGHFSALPKAARRIASS